jgi:hypothetical protein
LSIDLRNNFACNLFSRPIMDAMETELPGTTVYRLLPTAYCAPPSAVLNPEPP